MMRFALCLGFLLTAAPVLAEEWPPQIGAEIAERQEHCRKQGGEAIVADMFVQRIDLDGDGRDDFIMSDAGFHCSKGTPLYCGSGGCQVQVFMGQVDGTRSVLSRSVKQFTLKGRTLEVSQGKGHPKYTVSFIDGCAVTGRNKPLC